MHTETPSMDLYLHISAFPLQCVHITITEFKHCLRLVPSTV